MNKVTLALALTCAALIGCVASTLMVPAVRANTNPMRWEYNCFHSNASSPDVQSKANVRGAQGWEMTAAAIEDGGNTVNTDAVWCFKRALP